MPKPVSQTMLVVGLTSTLLGFMSLWMSPLACSRATAPESAMASCRNRPRSIGAPTSRASGSPPESSRKRRTRSASCHSRSKPRSRPGSTELAVFMSPTAPSPVYLLSTRDLAVVYSHKSWTFNDFRRFNPICYMRVTDQAPGYALCKRVRRNVNKPLANFLAWPRATKKTDVVCLQELKTTDVEFPADAIRRTGYDAAWRGHSPVVPVRLPCGGRRRRLSLGTGRRGVLTACWVGAELDDRMRLNNW